MRKTEAAQETPEIRKWWPKLQEFPDKLAKMEKRLLELEGAIQDFGRGQAVVDGLLLKTVPLGPSHNAFYKVITRTFLSASGGAMNDYTPENAIDGDKGTRMACESCHWTGDLGRVMTLFSVNVDWESCACTPEAAGKIEVSISGTTWQPFSVVGGISLYGGHTPRRYIGLAEARYVRISMSGQAIWFSIWEVSVSVEAEAETLAETEVETEVEVGGAPAPPAPSAPPAPGKQASSAKSSASFTEDNRKQPTSTDAVPVPVPVPSPVGANAKAAAEIAAAALKAKAPAAIVEDFPRPSAPPTAGPASSAAPPGGEARWRRDNKCGKRVAPLEDGSVVECDPHGDYPCCSRIGWCGRSMDHCSCKPGCIDYRQKQANTLPTPPVLRANAGGAGYTVVVTIPFRDRETHLVKFKKFWRWFAKEGQKGRKVAKWEIYIAEQFDSVSFNRGWNFNVGLALASQQKSASEDITPEMGGTFDCAVIQDIDYLPEEGVDYSMCDVPIQLSSEIDRYGGKVPYLRSAGGIVGMSMKHWQQINGFSNDYFGWGGEDDELFHRLRLTGLLYGDCYPFCRDGDPASGKPGHSIKRPPKGQGRFSGKYMHSANHTKRITDPKAYQDNLKLLGQIERGNDRWMHDGLSNLAFRIVTYTVDKADYNEYGITYHHVKARRGRNKYEVQAIKLAVPRALCTDAQRKEGWIVESLGDPMPWDLTALRNRVYKMLDKGTNGDCASSAPPMSFIVVDRRGHLAKIVSDENPSLLVAFYRSLNSPATDGLIIADPRPADIVRKAFVNTGDFLSPPAEYTICTSKLSAGSSDQKYSMQEGHMCGNGWNHVQGATFWAHSKNMQDSHGKLIPLTYCDNSQHWVQRVVKSEACPTSWEGLKWSTGTAIWVTEREQFCVSSGRNQNIGYSKVEPSNGNKCGAKPPFALDFSFGGVDTGHLFRSFDVCIARHKSGGQQKRIGPGDERCETEGWSTVVTFRAIIESAASSSAFKYCVQTGNGGDEIRSAGKCGSNPSLTFSLPKWSQSEGAGIHRTKICSGAVSGGDSQMKVVGIGDECGGTVTEELSFYATAAWADVAASTAGLETSEVPMYTLVEEEVPCASLFCKNVMLCAQKYMEQQPCSLTQKF